MGSPLHFEIAKQWLIHCDKEHRRTCHPKPWDKEVRFEDSGSPKLPTRVIAVGADGDQTVRLWETGPSDTGKYIALSHRWGPKPHPEAGKTTVANKERYIEEGISLQALPKTFRDAVTATRALEVPYLWIDSLCIVQTSDAERGDFDVEAPRMGAVFGSAYCVIAASRATGMDSGFLAPRPEDKERGYVDVQGGGGDGDGAEPLYICKNIDDFDADVLQAKLNTRGWVFQERALARRTLFFTDRQMYFECGVGVSCETMGRMRK